MNTMKKTLAKTFSIAGLTIWLAAPIAYADSEHMRPLKGQFSYTGFPTPTIDTACPIIGMNVGSGVLSHLGKVVFVSRECNSPQGPNFVMEGGEMMITAPNGDTLKATYSGTFVPTENPAIFQLSGTTYKIIGGTGRFEHASGHGDLQGPLNMATGQGSFTVTGNISY